MSLCPSCPSFIHLRTFAGLDEAAASARNAAKAIFDTDDMRHVGPYELTSAVVHDGFIGRDHTWTYFRHDDGRWFKLLDTQVYEVRRRKAMGT